MARTKIAVPEVGREAPEFHLPSAQGGQLRLSMRTARGPVVVVFYRPWSEEDIEYFRALSKKEDEINLALGSIVGIGVAEPDVARDFLRKSGIKSYVLYDYAKVATREWGLLQKDREHGEYARPATFIVDGDRKIVSAWFAERPAPEEILAKVSEITGLPKPAEEGEEEEKPKKKAARSGDGTERKKPSPEEREKRRAERKAAREAEGSQQTESEKPDQESEGEAKSDAEGDAKQQEE